MSDAHLAESPEMPSRKVMAAMTGAYLRWREAHDSSPANLVIAMYVAMREAALASLAGTEPSEEAMRKANRVPLTGTMARPPRKFIEAVLRAAYAVDGCVTRGDKT